MAQALAIASSSPGSFKHAQKGRSIRHEFIKSNFVAIVDRTSTPTTAMKISSISIPAIAILMMATLRVGAKKEQQNLLRGTLSPSHIDGTDAEAPEGGRGPAENPSSEPGKVRATMVPTGASTMAPTSSPTTTPSATPSVVPSAAPSMTTTTPTGSPTAVHSADAGAPEEAGPETHTKTHDPTVPRTNFAPHGRPDEGLNGQALPGPDFSSHSGEVVRRYRVRARDDVQLLQEPIHLLVQQGHDGVRDRSVLAPPDQVLGRDHLQPVLQWIQLEDGRLLHVVQLEMEPVELLVSRYGDALPFDVARATRCAV
jgi:hypothetical protein